MTPGATDPRVTQATIKTTICVSGYTTTVRPPESYTEKLKVDQIKAYGYQDTKLADYEEDHFIPLEIGGNPTDPKNLWPEPYAPAPGSHEKDRVENYLHDQVCSGAMQLTDAQQAVQTDWVAVYNKIVSGTASPRSSAASVTAVVTDANHHDGGHLNTRDNSRHTTRRSQRAHVLRELRFKCCGHLLRHRLRLAIAQQGESSFIPEPG